MVTKLLTTSHYKNATEIQIWLSITNVQSCAKQLNNNSNDCLTFFLLRRALGKYFHLCVDLRKHLIFSVYSRAFYMYFRLCVWFTVTYIAFSMGRSFLVISTRVFIIIIIIILFAHKSIQNTQKQQHKWNRRETARLTRALTAALKTIKTL